MDRRRIRSGLALCAALALAPVVARAEITVDEVAQAFGVPHEKLNDATVARSLTDAVRRFRAGDGDGLCDAVRDALAADESLGTLRPLLVNLLGGGADAELPPLRFVEINTADFAKHCETEAEAAHKAALALRVGPERAAALHQALSFARTLDRLQPDRPEIRYLVGDCLYKLGDAQAARAIMVALAPPGAAGFAEAHLWQADYLLTKPLTAATLDATEDHLQQALAGLEDRDEANRRLGEFYKFRYLRYSDRLASPQSPSRERCLQLAASHLNGLTQPQPPVLLSLAEVRGLQGRPEEAHDCVQRAIVAATQRLQANPDDVESRLSVARGRRMQRDFNEALYVLSVGLKLRDDPLLRQELSATYYFQARALREAQPHAFARQFELLRQSYRALPTDAFLLHRFVEALTSNDEAEVRAARTTLEQIVADGDPGAAAPFLLGFDRLNRDGTDAAEAYFVQARNAPPDATPEVFAGMAGAVFAGQVRSVPPEAAGRLYVAALRVWPDDAHLRMLRAQQSLLRKEFAAALADLTRAVALRPTDPKVHFTLVATYRAIGNTTKAAEHAAEAERLSAMYGGPAP